MLEIGKDRARGISSGIYSLGVPGEYLHTCAAPARIRDHACVIDHRIAEAEEIRIIRINNVDQTCRSWRCASIFFHPIHLWTDDEDARGPVLLRSYENDLACSVDGNRSE